jgi:hypothetical protein
MNPESDLPDVDAVNDETCLELSAPILESEISEIIKWLRADKSPGMDNLLNEFFVHHNQELTAVNTELFNTMLDTGHFPESWRVAAIVPVFKKGDRSTPGNYRGISLLSNLTTMFTSVLNKRLLDGSSKNNIGFN